MRRIRMKWLREGAFTRYALYALGEVLLIIVGILAALWIDNSRQERNEAALEKFYLEGLQDEFHSSLIKLDTLIAVNRNTYEMARGLLHRIPDAETKEDEAALAPMLIQAFSYSIAYNPNNSLLNEMINSGRLQTLSDPELRQYLTSWESFVESVNRQENSLRNWRQETMDIMLGPEGSILAIMQDAGMASDFVEGDRPRRDHSNLAVLKSLEFENNLLLFMATAESTETLHYLPLRQRILDIQKRIKGGLND